MTDLNDKLQTELRAHCPAGHSTDHERACFIAGWQARTRATPAPQAAPSAPVGTVVMIYPETGELVVQAARGPVPVPDIGAELFAASLTQAATSEPVEQWRLKGTTAWYDVSDEDKAATLGTHTGYEKRTLYRPAPPAAQQAPSDSELLADLIPQGVTVLVGRDGRKAVVPMPVLRKLVRQGAALSAQQAGVQEAPNGVLPCPFCGSADEVYAGKVTYCDNCGAEGPEYERGGKPVATWNTRAAPSASSAVVSVPSTSVTNEDAKGEANIDFSLKKGDTVYHPSWGDGTTPLIVVDVNWALRAVALRLSEVGGVVVWPVTNLSRAALASQGVKGGE